MQFQILQEARLYAHNNHKHQQTYLLLVVQNVILLHSCALSWGFGLLGCWSMVKGQNPRTLSPKWSITFELQTWINIEPLIYFNLTIFDMYYMYDGNNLMEINTSCNTYPPNSTFYLA